MTCYDETRHKPKPDSESYDPNEYPRVHRDGHRVDEIAENPGCFIGHTTPRRHQGRNSEWKEGQGE